jgi:hypothetical protein
MIALPNGSIWHIVNRHKKQQQNSALRMIFQGTWGPVPTVVLLRWLFNRSELAMSVFTLRRGEYQRDSGEKGDTLYINLDYVARVTPGAWDEWGGHIVLTDGGVFILRKDVFDRLTKAIQEK